MPRKGWKMPPGYAGYKRSTPSRRTPSRSAGPRMLSSLALPAPQNGASNGTDHGNEDVGDDAQPSTDSLNDFRAQNAAEQVPGLISSRLRPRRSQEGQEQGGGVTVVSVPLTLTTTSSLNRQKTTRTQDQMMKMNCL